MKDDNTFQLQNAGGFHATGMFANLSSQCLKAAERGQENKGADTVVGRSNVLGPSKPAPSVDSPVAATPVAAEEGVWSGLPDRHD